MTPTTTPTQFDPEQLIASIDRMIAYHPESMYLMHFSRVTDVPRLGESLKMQVASPRPDRARARARRRTRPRGIRADMLRLWLQLARAHGCHASSEATIGDVLGGRPRAQHPGPGRRGCERRAGGS